MLLICCLRLEQRAWRLERALKDAIEGRRVALRLYQAVRKQQGRR